jgi:hypothetical protein
MQLSEVLMMNAAEWLSCQKQGLPCSLGTAVLCSQH